MATLVAMSNIIRGLVFAGVGLGLGIALAILLTGITGEPLAEPAIALGYLLALIGWLLGVGVWKT